MLIAESGMPPRTLAVGMLLFSIASVGVSFLGTMVVIIRLPAGAFSETRRAWPRSIPGRILRVLMNVAGWILILIGLVLAVPGVPGQGLLTILMGLLLVDFPGRARLLRKILARPGIRRSIDRLRVRFQRPPFLW